MNNSIEGEWEEAPLLGRDSQGFEKLLSLYEKGALDVDVVLSHLGSRDSTGRSSIPVQVLRDLRNLTFGRGFDIGVGVFNPKGLTKLDIASGSEGVGLDQGSK